jgi:N-acetylglucosaminyldiphosphoundecaprenol N-acetyl-beta-D-mannosaminyltransferase
MPYITYGKGIMDDSTTEIDTNTIPADSAAGGVEEGVANPERVSFLKVPLDIVKEDALENIVYMFLEQKRGKNIVLLSLMDTLRARSNKEYKEYVQNASLVIPITKSLQRGSRFLISVAPVCYAPFDFIVKLLTILENREKTVYLLGGSPNILRISEKKIQQTFPKLRIVGRFPGGFRHSDEALIVKAIRKTAPDILLVGKGVRGGEKWIARFDADLNPGLRLWCSNIFEVFADTKKRPSRALYAKGLEGLYFAVRRPFRLFRIFPYIYYNILLIVYKLRKK